MPNNDREVFDHLTAEADAGTQERQIGFLSYALFAYEKREWIRLFRKRNADAEPSQADIDNWIANITESQFTTWRGEAERFFVEAADAYFEDQLDIERDTILRSAIVSEVKAAGAFWKQFAIALLTAVLAPLLLGAVISLAILYDKGMFSATSVSERIVGSHSPAAGPYSADPASKAPAGR